ncbi:putative inactive purple acid phosphatase 16 [Apostasia shenzhenica]|uniref:Putative inactive purple acid phosphatase 16 n=1 Tax=Apostasia shenzhenica TaxID=1088818 RepID=A0A2I0B1U6_9ASPA|nr:putative inactive purple acid phosphatase 16 [Apostasia shenzhenica]
MGCTFVCYVALSFITISVSSVVHDPVATALRFSGVSSPFKIALFADLHYGENAWDDWGAEQDANSSRVISAALDQEIPGI